MERMIFALEILLLIFSSSYPIKTLIGFKSTLSEDNSGGISH